MSTWYVVREYPADGCQPPPDALWESFHETLGMARTQVRRLLHCSILRAVRQWYPDDAIEGWSMYPPSHPRADGCGGYTISTQEGVNRTELRRKTP